MISRYYLFGLLILTSISFAEEIPVQSDPEDIKKEITAEIENIKQIIQDSIHDSTSGERLAKSFALLARHEKQAELLNIWLAHKEDIHDKAMQARIFLCAPMDGNTLCQQARRNDEDIRRFEIKHRFFRFK